MIYILNDWHGMQNMSERGRKKVKRQLSENPTTQPRCKNHEKMDKKKTLRKSIELMKWRSGRLREVVEIKKILERHVGRNVSNEDDPTASLHKKKLRLWIVCSEFACVLTCSLVVKNDIFAKKNIGTLILSLRKK